MKSSLQILSGDTLVSEISPNLRGNGLVQLSQTNQYYYRLFNSQLTQAKCKILMGMVADANYEKIEKAMTMNAMPELMFEEIEYKGELLSPLKLAFKNYDFCMWELFYSKIEDNEDYKKRFLQQANEQEKHVDTGSLNLYENFAQAYSRWLIHKTKPNENAMAKAWIELGKYLFYIAPKHILKELVYAPLNQLHMSMRFAKSYNKLSSSLQVYSLSEDKFISLSSMMNTIREIKDDDFNMSLLVQLPVGDRTQALSGSVENLRHNTYGIKNFDNLARNNARFIFDLILHRSIQFTEMKETLTERLEGLKVMHKK